MAGAVLGSLRIIPGHLATHMGARAGYRMELAILVAVTGDLLSTRVDDPALTGLEFGDIWLLQAEHLVSDHPGSHTTVLGEELRRGRQCLDPGGGEQFRPGVVPPADGIGDEHPGECAGSQSPLLESRGDVYPLRAGVDRPK